MIRQFGGDWLEWEADTLRVIIPEKFATPSVSDLNISKLQACRTLHLVDSFWQRWEVFAACLSPFNDEFPNFDVMQAPTAAQCLVAADAAQRIRDDVPWSTEMLTYLRVAFEHDGLFISVAPLDLDLHPPEGIDAKELHAAWTTAEAGGKLPPEGTLVGTQVRRALAAHAYLEASRTRLQDQLRLHA